MKNGCLLFFIIWLFCSCSSGGQQEPDKINNTGEPTEQAKQTFDTEESDARAVSVAEDVIKAMGGEDAWRHTSYLKWHFMGRRQLLWDKQTDRVKIYVPQQNLTINMNIEADTGNVFRNDKPVTDQDSLQRFLAKGEQMWANDSYWLVMPFKLKDPGVQLTYLREDSLKNGQPVDVIEATFDDVGFTPQNKYHIYVDQDSNLVRRWDFYQKASLDTPSMTTPWTDYQRYGDLLLSSGRGRLALSNIAVYDSVPDDVFAKPGMYKD